ncbi:hypothetical protein J7K27_09800, partial [Candidatus Bathyarchaeota archaeon]|nr:hypothetical protein [Candidatus Bathyarchaeota archaeon]
MRKKVVAALIAVTLLSMSTLAFHMPTASAQQTKIYVNPPTIKDVAPSENFTVFIVIENVLDLYGFDIQLRWDPSIIHCVGWELHVPVEDY